MNREKGSSLNESWKPLLQTGKNKRRPPSLRQDDNLLPLLPPVALVAKTSPSLLALQAYIFAPFANTSCFILKMEAVVLQNTTQCHNSDFDKTEVCNFSLSDEWILQVLIGTVCWNDGRISRWVNGQSSKI
jgi:hypothetical protein